MCYTNHQLGRRDDLYYIHPIMDLIKLSGERHILDFLSTIQYSICAAESRWVTHLKSRSRPVEESDQPPTFDPINSPYALKRLV